MQGKRSESTDTVTLHAEVWIEIVGNAVSSRERKNVTLHAEGVD